MKNQHKWRYDFDFVSDVDTLRDMICYINRHGYILVSVTQNIEGIYTIFFKRPADG